MLQIITFYNTHIYAFTTIIINNNYIYFILQLLSLKFDLF